MLLALDVKKGKPEECVRISHPAGGTIQLKMLVDSGADVSIVLKNWWPKAWPTIPANMAMVSAGGSQQTFISKAPVNLEFRDGSSITTRPYVMALPIALLDRDVLSQMGVRINNQDF